MISNTVHRETDYEKTLEIEEIELGIVRITMYRNGQYLRMNLMPAQVLSVARMLGDMYSPEHDEDSLPES